jgi:hypothetical protein
MRPSIRRLLLALGVGTFCFLSGCGGGGTAGPEAPSSPLSLSGDAAAEENASVTRETLAESLQTQDSALQTALPEAGTGTVKWNPGHYVVFASDDTVSDLTAGLNEIRNLRFVRGIVLRAFWRQLEPEKNVYDFGRIERFLHRAAQDKKRFFLLLSTRYFRSGRVAPDYLKTPLYDGGVYKFKSFKDTFGESITLWDDDTRHRLTLLIQALARRYDGNPNFEGLILTETAFGQPLTPISDAKKNAYYANMIRVDNAARNAFQRTVVIQFVNFPYPYTVPVFNNLLRKGLGFGAPDVFLADDDHEKYVYPFNDQARGRIPIGMQVEQDSYYSTSAGGPFDPPPVRSIYVFARDRLHSNYIFWHRDLSEPYFAWNKVLRMFRSDWFPDGAAGGLERKCPASYARCVTQAP